MLSFLAVWWKNESREEIVINITIEWHEAIMSEINMVYFAFLSQFL